MSLRRSAIVGLLVASAASCGGRQEAPEEPLAAPTEDPAAAAVAEVRGGYLGRDWWACARAGERLMAIFPDSSRLRGWTIACAASAGEEALPLAEAMLAEKPGDPWGLFARAAALISEPGRGGEEAVAAARAAAEALSHRDGRYMLGRALAVRGSRAEATAFLAAQPDRAEAPELLGLELALLAESDGEVEAQLQALAEQIRALDPSFVDGWFVPAAWLLARRRPAEAEVLLARALELSPHAPAIHARWWEAILQSERSLDERRAMIESGVAALLQARGDGPAALHAAAYVYDDLSPETARKQREELVARFPDSREAEWARIEEIRRLERALEEARAKGGEAATAAEQALRAAVDEFIAMPRHRVTSLLEEAHTRRYFLVKADAEAPPEEVLAAAQGFAAHTREFNLHLFAEVATTVAERTPYAVEAEAIAREGLRLAEATFAGPSGAMWGEEQRRGLRAMLLSGIGATLQAQGRFAEAREVLREALALDEGRHAEPFLRLAALAEAEGQADEAEQHLLDALMTEYRTDRVETALKGLYSRRRGSERGFAQYRAGVERTLREQRRAAVLETQIAEPQPLVPFALPRLGGGEVRSEELLGKIAVINLWATHCGPCVEEMPALQQLADAFAGARDVVITTINTDALTDPLPGWLAERKLRLEVLLGARWFFEAGYRVQPTTLFVDPQGRVVFVKEGATDRLVEEFTWRIEALRQEARRAGVRADAKTRG